MPSKPRPMTLFAVILASLAALAACAPSASAPAAAPPPGAQPGGVTSRVQIFSWWVSGTEATGLQKLYDLYHRDHPGIDIFNATVAGGGANARAVLKSRMTAGDPPDTFQIRLGHELTDAWVVPGYMEDLDQLYQTEGWNKVFPKGLLNLLSSDGHYWSVPIGVQRANVLWYNKQLMADNNLQPPKTLDDFFRVADALKAKGITPLALGDSDISNSTLVFESVLIGTMGADKYEGLWTGTTDWRGPEMKQSLDNFKRLLSYINTDHTTRSLSQASDLVLSGQAAMMIAGDWVDADAASKNKGGVLGWAVAPGNEGVFSAFGDTFTLPRNVRNRQNAVDWLRLIGSKDGQEAFNPIRGTLCARTDCNPSLFDPYAQSAAKDLSVSRVVPSLSQGAAASSSWLTSINDLMLVYVSKQDQVTTQLNLYEACLDQKMCR